VDTAGLEDVDPLHCGPLDVSVGVHQPCFLKSTISFLVLLTLWERLWSWHLQVSDLLLVPIGDQADHCCVVSKLDDGVAVVRGHTAMGEQGVQERAKHTPLGGITTQSLFTPSVYMAMRYRVFLLQLEVMVTFNWPLVGDDHTVKVLQVTPL
jgi:hypothetical protein